MRLYNNYVKSTFVQHIQPLVTEKLYYGRNQTSTASLKIASTIREFVSRHTNDTPIQLLWEEFKLMYINCISTVQHKFSCSRFNQPWVTMHIKHIHRRKKKLYNQTHVSYWYMYYCRLEKVL